MTNYRIFEHIFIIFSHCFLLTKHNRKDRTYKSYKTYMSYPYLFLYFFG